MDQRVDMVGWVRRGSAALISGALFMLPSLVATSPSTAGVSSTGFAQPDQNPQQNLTMSKAPVQRVRVRLKVPSRRILRGDSIRISGTIVKAPSSKKGRLTVSKRTVGRQSSWAVVKKVRLGRRGFSIRDTPTDGPRVRYRVTYRNRTVSNSPAVKVRLNGVKKKLAKGTRELAAREVLSISGAPGQNQEIVVKKSAGVRVGQVLVMNVSTAYPEGFLGRVIEVSRLPDGTQRLETRPATLQDAYEEFQFSHRLRPDSSMSASLQRLPFPTFSCSVSGGTFPTLGLGLLDDVDFDPWGRISRNYEGWITFGFVVRANAYSNVGLRSSGGWDCTGEIGSPPLPVPGTPLAVEVAGGVSLSGTTDYPLGVDLTVLRGRYGYGFYKPEDENRVHYVREWEPDTSETVVSGYDGINASISVTPKVSLSVKVAGVVGLGVEGGLGIEYGVANRCVTTDLSLVNAFFVDASVWNQPLLSGSFHLAGPYHPFCLGVSDPSNGRKWSVKYLLTSTNDVGQILQVKGNRARGVLQIFGSEGYCSRDGTWSPAAAGGYTLNWTTLTEGGFGPETIDVVPTEGGELWTRRGSNEGRLLRVVDRETFRRASGGWAPGANENVLKGYGC